MHKMKLQPAFFYYMLNGTKRIELRLNDEKRQLINVGDEILFLKEPNLDEEFLTKVTNIYKYDSFNDLFNDFEIDVLADKNMSKEELLSELEKYYTKDSQDKYGVLGIEIEIIKDK